MAKFKIRKQAMSLMLDGHLDMLNCVWRLKVSGREETIHKYTMNMETTDTENIYTPCCRYKKDIKMEHDEVLEIWAADIKFAFIKPPFKMAKGDTCTVNMTKKTLDLSFSRLW